MSFQDARAFSTQRIIQDPPIQMSDILVDTRGPLVFPARRQILVDLSLQIRIYILCFDEASEVLAKQRFDVFSWSKIVRIPTELQKDGLFENVMQDSLLETLSKEWQSLDYVGLLSQKSVQRIPVHFLDALFTKASQNLQTKYVSQDCIFFQGSSGSIHATTRVHPYFSKIWNDILVNQLGIVSEECSCFNQWMCRPSVMKEYIQFFHTLFPKILKHPDAFQNANYKGGSLSEEDLVRVNGLPYYTHIPFILERVPRNWALHNKYNICVQNQISIKEDLLKENLIFN